MAQMVFQKILDEGTKKGNLPRESRQATRWFQQKARRTRSTPRQVWAEKERHKHYTLRRRLLGNMYYFFYEAEGKDNLPYWDSFPLVIPIELTKDGFLGINFHYLDWRLRAIFMDRILDLVRETPDAADRSDQSQKGKLDWRLRAIFMDRLLDLVRETPDAADRSEQSQEGKLDWRKINYNRLSRFAKYKYFRPCLKQYKFSNMRSRMIQLSKEEWDIALFLPLERFQNSRKQEVWMNSRQQVMRRGGK